MAASRASIRSGTASRIAILAAAAAPLVVTVWTLARPPHQGAQTPDAIARTLAYGL